MPKAQEQMPMHLALGTRMARMARMLGCLDHGGVLDHNNNNSCISDTWSKPPGLSSSLAKQQWCHLSNVLISTSTVLLHLTWILGSWVLRTRSWLEVQSQPTPTTKPCCQSAKWTHVSNVQNPDDSWHFIWYWSVGILTKSNYNPYKRVVHSPKKQQITKVLVNTNRWIPCWSNKQWNHINPKNPSFQISKP